MNMDLCRRSDLSSLATATAEEKVCVIVAINGYMGIFLLDLGKDQDLEGADANEFVDTLPNFRIDVGFDFSAVKGKLCLIDSYSRDFPPHVYNIELEKVSMMSNERLDRTGLTKCPDCFSRKKLLRCLPYRDSLLLIFSSRIHFQYYYDDKIYEFEEFHDFELYDPAGDQGRVLPQLVVCLPRHSYNDNVLRLYDPDSKTFYDEGFIGSGPYGSESYNIVLFGVDVVEDKFIIGTKFGRMFSLKLDGSDRWRLCGEEGYNFLGGSKNIVTWNGICLDAFVPLTPEQDG